jgi:hypothetical protein
MSSQNAAMIATAAHTTAPEPSEAVLQTIQAAHTEGAETVLFDAVVRALGARFGLGELRRLPPFVASAGHA